MSFHHSPRHNFALVTLFCLTAISSIALSQTASSLGPKRIAPPPKFAPMTDQHISMLFAGQGTADRIILTLNNNRAGTLLVTPTLFRLSGDAVKLPAIDLKQSESRLIELGDSLRKSGIEGQFGYMDLEYSGRVLELGAQLTLYPISDKGGLDSPRSLAIDFKSTERATVAWLPKEADTVVALTNVSSQVITVRLSSEADSPQVVIGPHETILRNHRFEGASKEVIAFDADYDGPVDAIRAFGYVKSWKSGSFPLRFSDPAASTSSLLNAVGLRTTAPTHIALQNLSDQPVEYHLHLAEIGSEKPKMLDSAPSRLKPHTGEVVSITSSLRQMMAMGVERATLTLKTDPDARSFVAAATQELQNALLEDVPFRPSNPRLIMRGAYPLRWTEDYTNFPMVANVSNAPMTVRAYAIVGGVTYTFPLRTVAPDTTAVFDVDQLRAKQTPDINGKVIPLDAKFGKFHWAPMVRTPTTLGLSGRNEEYSLMNSRASSFSCQIACEYENESYPYFDNGFEGLYKAPFQTAARISGASMGIWDSYGNYATYPIADNSMFGTPHFDTTTVLNAFVQGNNTTVQSDTGNYGITNFHYNWVSYNGQPSEDGSFCEYPLAASEDLGGPGQVPACPIPDSESTSYVRQALVDPVGAPTASDFLQTLVTLGNDDGNLIIESNNANGNDSCSFDSTVPPVTSVSGTTWTVAQITPGYAEAQVVVPGHNQWGPDVIGYGPTAVRYYQLNRPKLGLSMPCGFSLHQNLEIQCVQDGTRTTYKADTPLSSTIDATGITNCRSGACSSHVTYP